MLQKLGFVRDGGFDGNIVVVDASLLLLLLVRNTSSFGLAVLDFTEVDADGAVAERVRLGGAAVLLVGSAKSADEGIEATPRLAQWASAGCGRVGLPEEHAAVEMDLRLPELVEVPEELQHVVAAALR